MTDAIKIGMLWFDNSDKTLEERIRGAVSYYRTKYAPTSNYITVYVNPEQAEVKPMNNIDVRPNRSIRYNHFWVGAGQEAEREM
jgi:hypothetical protein